MVQWEKQYNRIKSWSTNKDQWEYHIRDVDIPTLPFATPSDVPNRGRSIDSTTPIQLNISATTSGVASIPLLAVIFHDMRKGAYFLNIFVWIKLFQIRPVREMLC